jgi:threonine dehydrogenase-like Zn-dependent dehydrogenase
MKCPGGFVCGHEFVREIVEKGDEVRDFEVGDKVSWRGRGDRKGQ